MDILIIQLAKMGDLFQTELFVSALERTNNHLVLLHSEVFTEAAQLLTVEERISINLDLVTTITKTSLLPKFSGEKFLQYYSDLVYLRKFDLIFNLNSNDFSVGICRLLSADRKLGFSSNDKQSTEWLSWILSFIKTRRYSTFNLVDIQKGLIPAEIRKKDTPNQKIKEIFPINPNSRIVLQPGSRNEKRQYPADEFALLAKKLIQCGHTVVLVGSGSETALSKRIVDAQEIQHANKIQDLTGKTTISELKEVIDSANLLITTDTGTMHLAALSSLPTLAIFHGPAYPFETLAYNSNVRCVITNAQKFACYPCPDEDICAKNLECRTLYKPEDLVNLITKNAIIPGVFRISYDEAGQFLHPLSDQEHIHHDLFLAYHYRKFALKYFWGIDISISDYINLYQGVNEVQEAMLRALKRELKLLAHLQVNTPDLWTAKDNFQLLLPFIYLFKILGNCQLVDELRTFLISIDNL